METKTDRELGFTWPPNPAEPEKLAAPDDAAYWRWPGAIDSSTRAVPEHSVDAPREAAIAAAPPGWLRRVREVWRAVESAWLGAVSLPISEAVASGAWAPDPRTAYCGRCGVNVGPGEETEESCAACRSSRLPWRRCIRLGSYTGPLRRWIHETKFGHFRGRGYELGRWLGRALGERLGEAGVDAREVVLVPVPSHWMRRWLRGVDHTKAICRGVQRELGCRRADALRRRGMGRSQLAMTGARRAENVRMAFQPRGRLRMENVRVIVVIDDVKTTGATMRAACRALRGGIGSVEGVEVWAGVAGVTRLRRAAASEEVAGGK